MNISVQNFLGFARIVGKQLMNAKSHSDDIIVITTRKMAAVIRTQIGLKAITIQQKQPILNKLLFFSRHIEIHKLPE